MDPLIQRQTSLPAHAIQFSRFLRDKGFEIGPNEELDLLRAFQVHVPNSFEEQHSLYKAIWVKNQRQYILFDDLYEQYWKELSKAEDSKTKEDKKEKNKRSNSAPSSPPLQALKSWLYGGRIEEEEQVASYSAFEALGKKDFSGFRSEELKDFIQLIQQIVKRMANTYSRRYIRSNATKVLDLKNTIRKSLRNGGHIDKFLFKKQQKRKVNIVLLCDVSKSMELYSKFLIEFMYSFQQVVSQLKTFVFSTQLVSLSRTLSDGNFEKVLENLSEQVPYWSGGTRIGECLDTFVKNHGGQLLNKDTILIIVSDGWDTGDLEILENAMRYLHKKSHQVIWLNPLAGNPNYKPETKAMKVCMPFIDVFSAAHDVESLNEIKNRFTQP